MRLLIHEYSPDHLSAQYPEALWRIGAKVFLLARQGQLAWAGAVRQRLASGALHRVAVPICPPISVIRPVLESGDGCKAERRLEAGVFLEPDSRLFRQ